ncbi:hypothetical protein Tco_0434963 [Tanacetum coccineum]
MLHPIRWFRETLIHADAESGELEPGTCVNTRVGSNSEQSHVLLLIATRFSFEGKIVVLQTAVPNNGYIHSDTYVYTMEDGNPVLRALTSKTSSIGRSFKDGVEMENFPVPVMSLHTDGNKLLDDERLSLVMIPRGCVARPLLSLDILLPSIRFSLLSHPTSNIEDYFSSNFPNYIPAFLDYVPASPGKTYSSSSNNSFSLVPIPLPTLSLFHDDPYMKVIHAYYAKESPNQPPTIVPPSSMLSPMFNPQEFVLPEELLPLKKRGRDRSYSFTSALPQEFEIGESSRKTSLERHEEQIEEILNHLDELSLDRIKHIE